MGTSRKLKDTNVANNKALGFTTSYKNKNTTRGLYK